jgi:hypothetical protein
MLIPQSFGHYLSAIPFRPRSHDPHILSLSRQHDYHYNLLEVIKSWCEFGIHWDEPNGNRPTWEGAPHDLLQEITNINSSYVVAKEWSTQRWPNP